MRRRSFLGAALALISVAVSAASLALRSAAAQVSVVRRPRPMRLPPTPKWNKATDDLDNNDYLRRVQDYERSLLPPDIVFPQTGQIWEAVRDCEVNWMAWPILARPIGWSGRARLQRGERVRILTRDDPKPIHVTFQPLRYHELHERIVSRDIRNVPGYRHYILSLRTAYTMCCSREETGYFHELFRLVEDVI